MATIVFCEDEPAIRQLIQIVMRRTPHTVLVAEDGESGLDLIEETRPDLVVTDVAMPGMTGLELCDALKARPALAQIPVVVLSASTQRPQREEAARHQVAGYIEKPFSPDELRAHVEAYLRVAGSDRQATG